MDTFNPDFDYTQEHHTCAACGFVYVWLRGWPQDTLNLCPVCANRAKGIYSKYDRNDAPEDDEPINPADLFDDNWF